jgi:amino-acid N-acetyltransferase
VTTPTIRRARISDADAISALNNRFADQALMLRRSPEMVAMAIDDYLVAVDDRGSILGCGAKK